MTVSNTTNMSTAYTPKYAYLMTPEEQTATSFSPEHGSLVAQPPKLPPIHGLASPPTSPAFQSLPAIDIATGFRSVSPPSSHPTPAFCDDALFPQDIDRARPQSPLFRDGDSIAARAQASEHQPDTVAFSLNFPFDLDITTHQQAWDYWKGCCDDANRSRRCHLPMPLSSISAHRDPISVRQLQSIERSHARAAARSTATRSHRPAKSVPSSTSEHHRERKTISPTVRHATRPKQQHQQQQNHHHHHHHHHTSSATHITSPPTATSPPRSPDDRGTAKHRRAPASKPRPIGESWTDVPDYCPPLSSLATAPRPLRARPVGSSGPLDLSRDPDRDQLHPDELAVASTLRLQCAKYLLNKRKIFKAKLEHLQGAAGTANFNKTEAQKACTIDVNKASSLYAAFEEVGWFRREWFEKYL